MKNWKIKRIYYISSDDLITGDIYSSEIYTGSHIYNFYQRKLWFFWVLKRQMKDEAYFNLKKQIENDGFNIRDVFIHSNF